MKPIHAKPSLYAFYFEVIKEIGMKYGYNIVLHGSMNRDLDLIAIPWEEELGFHHLMVREVAKLIGGTILMQNRSVDNPNGDSYSEKSHGRVVYLININRDLKPKLSGFITDIKEYVDPMYYIDLSVIIVK